MENLEFWYENLYSDFVEMLSTIINESTFVQCFLNLLTPCMFSPQVTFIRGQTVHVIMSVI